MKIYSTKGVVKPITLKMTTNENLDPVNTQIGGIPTKQKMDNFKTSVGGTLLNSLSFNEKPKIKKQQKSDNIKFIF